MGLPVACNTCGGGGPVANYEMINQNIEYSELDIFDGTSFMQFSFSIRYEAQIVAMIPKKNGSFGLAFACSPPPIYFVNTITGISITSNKAFYEFASGEELISLFKRSFYGESESLVFPIELESNAIQLKMIGPIPDMQEHSFTIKSMTSDNKEFVSILNIGFQ